MHDETTAGAQAGLALSAGGGHERRDLLAFTVAFAIAFLLAWRDPDRHGRPLLPVTAAATLATSFVSATGTTVPPDLLVEVGHLTVLAGLLGLLLLPSGRAGPRTT